MRPSRSGSFALVALCLLVGGCGAAPPSSTSVTVTPTASATASPTRTPAAAPTSTREVDVQHEPGEAALVSTVRFATHQGYDRVVIDLRGEMPGYTVKWVDELVQDASGKPIHAKGGAYLQVVLTPAQAHTDKGDPTWTGGPVFQANLGNVTDVVKTGDFEGRVGVGIVLDHRAPFRVLEQRGPNRLVIDVAN
ncbi:AMIN-like domain-containing (lipo)protein [Nonomuraea sediminis]|uniref:AMIN-like domain-containing (lipo)protein n=1 Tax=Nonomuraea sediminis TaxID=2835864 RepID=UPI001BDC3995|nr:hypothetical protein [Nonomuraea sediminis]